MNEDLRYKGRLAQARIYLGKCFRMFIYQNDWKVLPIGALIAAIVTFVVGTNIFKTQEGTEIGVFALVCVCIWNGFFNSIQVVCREREIVKREHRAGLHMSAYVLAQMVYQLFLCALQTVVTLAVCMLAQVTIPQQGVITPWGLLDVSLTILLITYAADIMALMVSCIVRTTTTAMTVMPFLLIFQLIFSGGFFDLSGLADKIKYLTLSHWGMTGLCCIGRYNEQPMVSLWNMLVRFKNVEYNGQTPLKTILIEIENSGSRDEFLLWAGQQNQMPEYAATIQNVLVCMLVLLVFILVFAIASVIALEFIDRDKR